MSTTPTRIADLDKADRTAFYAWRNHADQKEFIKGKNEAELLQAWKEAISQESETVDTEEPVEQTTETQDPVTEPENPAPQHIATGVVDVQSEEQAEPEAPVTTQHNQRSNAPVTSRDTKTLVEPHLVFARERLTDNQYGAFLDLPEGLRAQFVIVLQYVDNMHPSKAQDQDSGVAHQESLYGALVKILNQAGPQMRLAMNLLLSIYHAHREAAFDPHYANRFVRHIKKLRESDARLFVNLQTLFIVVAEPKNRQAKVKHMDLTRVLSDVGKEPTLVTQQAKNNLIAFLKG